MDAPTPSPAVPGKRKPVHVGENQLSYDGLFVDENDRHLDKGKRIKIELDDDDDDDEQIDDADDLDPTEYPGEEGYSEKQEMFPQCAAFDERIPAIKTSLEIALRKALVVVDSHPCDSVHVDMFRRRAQKLSTIPTAEPVRIALLGNAGAGKSSLLNALSDIPGLARAGSVGNSCTCVATEYGAAFPDQKKTFAANVEYFDLETIRALLQEHVDAYFEYFWEPPEDMNEEEREECRLKANTALKIFLALFPHTKEFASEEVANEYLDSKRLDKAPIVPQMFAWAQRLFNTEGKEGNSNIYYREAADEEEYQEVISPLLIPRETGRAPALWPLVSYVTIGVRGSRVLDHVTMVDLPGINDTNQVKVKATLGRMRTCAGLWIVTPIGRAIDDVTLSNMFSTYEERFRGNIAIICTRSDVDVNTELQKSLEDRGVSTAGIKKLDNELKKAQGEVSAIKRKIYSRMQALNTKERASKVGILKEELAKSEKKFKDLKNAKFASLVRTRNNYVVKGLKKEFAARLEHKPDVLVFCVSNEHYNLLKVGDDELSAQLRPKDTGITDLRAHALGLAAPGIMQTLEDYVEHDYTVFLKGLGLWAISRHIEGGEELLSIVERPQRMIGDTLEIWQQELEAFVKEHLEETLLRVVPKHARTAHETFEKKRTEKHPSTLKAFMRKGGKHKTKNCPEECWNEQFLEPTVKALTHRWGKVNTKQTELSKSTQAEMEEEMDGILRELKDFPGTDVFDMTNIELMLQGQAKGIENAFRAHQQYYVQEMKNIKLDATQDRPTAFFTQAMKETYEKCKADKGPGTVLRSSNILISHLTLEGSNSPFAVAIENTYQAIIKNAKAHLDILQKGLEEIFRDVYSHFDGMIDKNALNPGEQPVRDALKKYLDEAGPVFQKVLQDLEKVKAKYKVSKEGR